jgi:hypothetical protein
MAAGARAGGALAREMQEAAKCKKLHAGSSLSRAIGTASPGPADIAMVPPTLPASAGMGFSFLLLEHTVNQIHMPVFPVYSL